MSKLYLEGQTMKRNGLHLCLPVWGQTVTIEFRNWDLCEYPLLLLPLTKSQTWAIKLTSRLEKPRFVILAFQTGRRDIETNDLSR